MLHCGNMKHLEGLNEEQKNAVIHKDGPLLIVAGAGAGKTRVITHRILHLIKNGVSPQSILAITFTNKAAKEMLDRVINLIASDKELNLPMSFNERPFISTFHALGVNILRENSKLLDLSKHFVILDDNDTTSIMKEALKNVSLDPKQFEPRQMKNAISKQKGNLVNVKTFTANAGNEYFPRILSVVWNEYEKLLKKNGGVDFDDLILKTVELLKNNTDVRNHYQTKWKYIHIDEYQDTNMAQYELSQILAGKNKHICVVGDMDQSIYSWRGADFRNIMNFEKDYPEAKIVLLEQNYRSTANILCAANDIIKKNKVRKEKNLFTKKEGGAKIGLFTGYNETEEASFVAKKSKELLKDEVPAKDIAVLYRANFQSRALEEAFLDEHVPYQVLGVKFFDRKEVKDVLAFIRVALNPNSLHDIKRIINVPPRGIGKVTLAKIFSGQEDTLPAKMKEKISLFRTVLAQIKNHAEKERVSTTVKFVIKITGMENMFKKGTEEDQERLENVKELVTLATKYDILSPEEGLAKLLEDAALASDQDSLLTTKKEDKNAVKLMTVHASKGLEFPYVFITGLEQDLFPHAGMGKSREDEGRQEEERRLFYVAITRAEKKAIMTYCSIRTVFGMKQVNMPSEFITDIDESIIKEESLAEPDIYF